MADEGPSEAKGEVSVSLNEQDPPVGSDNSTQSVDREDDGSSSSSTQQNEEIDCLFDELDRELEREMDEQLDRMLEETQQAITDEIDAQIQAQLEEELNQLHLAQEQDYFPSESSAHQSTNTSAPMGAGIYYPRSTETPVTTAESIQETIQLAIDNYKRSSQEPLL